MLVKHNSNGLELKSQWQFLFQNSVSDRREQRKVLLDLIHAYSSNTRFYHSLSHIKQILTVIAGLQTLAKNYPAIQLAAWFHDVIYNPMATDNEEKSAEYAALVLTKLNVASSTIDAVTRMILNTKNHQAAPEDIDSQILLDADLAILGDDEASYQFYARGIRREYAYLNGEKYRLKRLNFLQNLLQRSRIYYTEPMFHQYEAKARHNILWEIAALSGQDSCLRFYGGISSAA